MNILKALGIQVVLTLVTTLQSPANAMDSGGPACIKLEAKAEVATSEDSASLENAAFDKAKVEPAALVEKMYKESQILFMGKVTHSNYEIYHHLMRLLDKVGTDPNLKYLAVERSFIFEELFQSASVSEMNPALIDKFRPLMQEHKYPILDRRQTDPFLLCTVMPAIQAINQKRAESKIGPLSVVPLDSYVESLKLPNGKVHAESIYTDGRRETHFWEATGVEVFAQSFDREQGTQKNFENKVFSKLKKGEKAIVVYHFAHLIQGLEVRYPVLNENKTAWLDQAPDWHPMTWLGLFFKDHSEARATGRILIFDEEDSFRSPKGTFRLTQRQKARNGGAAFAIPLEPLHGISPEKGFEILDQSWSSLPFPKRGSVELSDLADGLIYSPQAAQKTALQREALLTRCAEMTGYSLSDLKMKYMPRTVEKLEEISASILDFLSKCNQAK